MGLLFFINLMVLLSCGQKLTDSTMIRCISDDFVFFTIEAEYTAKILTDEIDGKTAELFDHHLMKLIGGRISSFIVQETSDKLYTEVEKIIEDGSLIELTKSYLSDVKESSEFKIKKINLRITEEAESK